MTKNLKPCPFCGSNEIKLISTKKRSVLYGLSESPNIRCECCGGHGPWADTNNIAKKLWNARKY